MKAFLIALCLMLGLTGCGLLQPKQPTERVVYKFIHVPSEMSQKVSLTPPPEATLYSTLSWDKQEAVLVQLIQDHTQTIGMCNARLYSIADWSNKQIKIYEPDHP